MEEWGVILWSFMMCSLSVLSVFTGSRIVTGHHIELPYLPVLQHAVMCNNNAILVAARDPAALHIHSWSGQHLQKLTTQQLGIQEDDRILAAAYNDRRQTLQLAVRRYDMWTVDLLHSCLVSDITSPYTHITTHSHHSTSLTPLSSILQYFL